MAYRPDRSAAHVDRRGFLRAGTAAGLGAIALSGCGGDAAAGDSPLELWHLFSGGDGGIFVEMLSRAESELPDIAIDPVVLTWGGPYYTKLAMASVGGGAPDVAAMHASRIPAYAPGGLLEPWDLDELAAVGISEETVAPRLWEAGSHEGNLYGVPMDFHAFPLFYNTELCDEAGVLDSDGNLSGLDSVEGFYEVADAIASATGQHAISYGYTDSGAQVARMFWGLYQQLAGPLDELTPGEPPPFDPDAAVRVVEFVQGLLDDTRAPRNLDEGAAISAFNGQRSAMIFSGNWEVPTFTESGIPYDVMPMPTLFDQPATFGDSHVFVLPKQDNPDREQRRNAYRVVGSMIDNSLLWADGGHIPASTEVRESDEYLAKEPQSHYASAVDNATFWPSAWFTGSGSDFEAQMSEALVPAFLDGADAEESVERLHQMMIDSLQLTPPY